MKVGKRNAEGIRKYQNLASLGGEREGTLTYLVSPPCCTNSGREDLARRAALGTFPTVAERVLGLYHEDAIWYEDQPPVMNERPCDNEEDGTRSWEID